MSKIVIGLLHLLSVNSMAVDSHISIQGLYQGVSEDQQNCYLLILTRDNSKNLLAHLILKNTFSSNYFR